MNVPHPYWDPQHPVLEILRRRRDSRSMPGNRTDSATVALAVGGGGMRGVTSAAMCTQLHDEGFGDAFDIVYGCSAGALNAAYFVTGDCWFPLSIYYDDLVTKRFIDYTRVLRGRAIMDLDFVFGELLGGSKALDYRRAVDAAVRLVVAITDVDDCAPVAAGSFTSAGELENVLRAGVRLPLATPGTAEVGGRRILDGGLLMPLPFRMAVADGCTHILSLGTRRPAPPSDIHRVSVGHRLVRLHLERIRPGLGAAYATALRDRGADELWLAQRRFDASSEPRVLDLSPLPWMPDIRMNELDRHRVFDAARAAYALSHCATEGIDPLRLSSGALHAIARMTVVDPSAHSTPSVPEGAGRGTR